MSDIRLSLIHASYKSKGQGKKVRDYWLAQAVYPEFIEHCLGFESTDNLVREEFEIGQQLSGITPDGITKFKATKPESSPSAVRNWNAAASISSGEILVGIADDLLPDYGWDEQIWKKTRAQSHDIGLWKINDERCTRELDIRINDLLPRHPVINRKLYEKFGFYFDPRYVSVGPDDEWLLQSIKGSFLNDAREIRFHHTIGSIFDLNGAVQCGCEGNSVRKNSTRGQSRMHQSRWRNDANKTLAEWGTTWRIIGGLSVSHQFPDEILRLIRKFSGISALSIIVRLFFSPRVKLRYKFSLLFLVIKEIIRR